MNSLEESGDPTRLAEKDKIDGWPWQRHYVRHELDTELSARLLPKEQEPIRGRSLDISVAGIGGIFVTAWQIGTRVLLEFTVPVSKERLRVHAIVRNRCGYRYGFEFADLSDRERALIQKTCRVLALLK